MGSVRNGSISVGFDIANTMIAGNTAATEGTDSFEGNKTSVASNGRVFIGPLAGNGFFVGTEGRVFTGNARLSRLVGVTADFGATEGAFAGKNRPIWPDESTMFMRSRTVSRITIRKIEPSAHGVSLPLDLASEIKRTLPNRRADGASIHPGKGPLLLGDRIGHIEDEAASIAKLQFGRGPDEGGSRRRPHAKTSVARRRKQER